MQIYLITNLKNGMRYVGQTTTTLKNRWQGHIRCVRDGLTTHLYNAIRFHGKENFKIESLEECATREALNEREIAWIQELKTMDPHGYNWLPGGEVGIMPRDVIDKRTENIVKAWEDNDEMRGRLSVEFKERWKNFTPEQREEVILKMKQKALVREKNKTPEQKKKNAFFGGQGFREKIKNMTPEEYKAFCDNRKKISSSFHKNLTPEQKEAWRLKVSQGKKKKPSLFTLK